MSLNLWHQNRYVKLPKPVKEYMIHRFNLLPEYVDMLRCFEYAGLFDDKPVMYLAIFYPDIIQGQRLTIKDHHDLEAHPEMLLYRGHIDDQGNVYVTDRRAPMKRVKVS